MRKLPQGHFDQRNPGEAAGPGAGGDGVECSERHAGRRSRGHSLARRRKSRILLHFGERSQTAIVAAVGGRGDPATRTAPERQ